MKGFTSMVSFLNLSNLINDGWIKNTGNILQEPPNKAVSPLDSQLVLGQGQCMANVSLLFKKIISSVTILYYFYANKGNENGIFPWAHIIH